MTVMTEGQRSTLRKLATKYIWWKSPDEAPGMPERIIAQVMDIGDYTDVRQLERELGASVMKDVVRHAQAGQFTERSWHFWHYRLGLASIEQVPAMPVRNYRSHE